MAGAPGPGESHRDGMREARTQAARNGEGTDLYSAMIFMNKDTYIIVCITLTFNAVRRVDGDCLGEGVAAPGGG
jgi:glucuronate isomerase